MSRREREGISKIEREERKERKEESKREREGIGVGREKKR